MSGQGPELTAERVKRSTAADGVRCRERRQRGCPVGLRPSVPGRGAGRGAGAEERKGSRRSFKTPVSLADARRRAELDSLQVEAQSPLAAFDSLQVEARCARRLSPAGRTEGPSRRRGPDRHVTPRGSPARTRTGTPARAADFKSTASAFSPRGQVVGITLIFTFEAPRPPSSVPFPVPFPASSGIAWAREASSPRPSSANVLAARRYL